MAEETKKNITCPECGKDAPEADYAENGRCPACGFNYQLYRDTERVEAARKKAVESEKKEQKQAEPKKRRLW
jgi:ribosomal protein L37E